jgi:hypothetical protein
MSPLVIPANQDASQFRTLLENTFPNLAAQIAADDSLIVRNKAALIQDYAEIGAFLSNNALVHAALATLNARLLDKIDQVGNANLTSQVKDKTFAGTGFASPKTTNARNESIILKTHKVLSSVLKAREDLEGFNNYTRPAEPRGDWQHSAIDRKDDRLHSRARTGTAPLVADAQGRFALEAVDPTRLPTRPVGVPTLTSVVGGMDFQRILLRHGYHWKDPGAGGVTHGEYTHRLQWYAILEKSPPLTLANKPLEIFKSMGSIWSRSNYPGPPDRSGHTYLWEVLFDCFPEGTDEPDFRPRSGTYNCPDNLTAFLTNNGNWRPPPTDDPLFALKVLMMVRRYKRAVLGNWEPARRFSAGSPKTATTVFQQSSQGADAGRIGAFLVWYNS